MTDVQECPPAVATDRAVDVSEAAEIVGVSAITIKRATAAWLEGDAAELPSFKVGQGEGRRRKIWVSDIRAWATRRAEAERARRAAGNGGAA